MLIQTNNFIQTSSQNQTHFIRHFLTLKKANSIHTAISYERDILDFFQTKTIEAITLEDIVKVNLLNVEYYLLDMRGRGLAASTINRKIASLSALYKWLLRFQDNQSKQALITFNPFTNLKEELPKINSKETAFLTQEECIQILNSFDMTNILELRNKTILSLALTTALRKSEMINIKLEDISTYAQYDVIHITRKGNVKDMIKIQPEVKQLIMQYIKQTNRHLQTDSQTYLFIGHSKSKRNRQKLDPSTLNYMMKAVCQKAGIDKPLNVHSTRHTAITLAITSGASIEKVRDFAAHKTIVTTNRYVHSINSLEENAGDVIDIFSNSSQ